ncbi:MAG: Asp23/Gls24 family envelope stress response protein [Bulleidia sp.]
MAQDYVVLDGNRESGMTAVNKSVFRSIAEISISDIENAVTIPETRFYKPVSVKIDDNSLCVNADIRVKFGANVSATCELVQNKIFENIMYMTGIKPSNISIHVTGFEIA